MLYPPSSLHNVGMRGGDDVEIDRPATQGTRGGNSVQYAVINPWRMRRRVTVLGLCVCVCVCVSVQPSSAIAPNKNPRKGHYMNQCPMGKILKSGF